MKLKSLQLKNLKYKLRVFWDRVNGLDFTTIIEPHEVGLSSKNAYRSSPSGNEYLEKVFIDFDISSHDSIIDIGCGKGSAMRTMTKFPFSLIDGLELSEKIANIAINNFKRLNQDYIRIFINDAINFQEYDAYNFIYLYNPFPDVVMKEVMNALIQSIYKSEREVIIIYNNPTCHLEIVRHGIFIKIASYPDQWGNGISIYSNKGFKSARLPGQKL